MRTLESVVGLFMIAGVLAFAILALKVSGLSTEFSGKGYEVSALFDNVGDLKVRAPVTIGGVKVGQVVGIALDPASFRARVTLKIDANQNHIPADSSASIFTQGLLGSNYISISPGFDETMLANQGEIEMTHSALILENLIGQFLFSMNKDSKKEGSK